MSADQYLPSGVEIIISFVLTVVLYSAGPLIFASKRKKTITKWRLIVFCSLYTVCIFFAFNLLRLAIGDTFSANATPAFFWGTVHYFRAKKRLHKRGLLIEESEEPVLEQAPSVEAVDDSATLNKYTLITPGEKKKTPQESSPDLAMREPKIVSSVPKEPTQEAKTMVKVKPIVKAEAPVAEKKLPEPPQKKKRFVALIVVCVLLVLSATAAAVWFFQQTMSMKETVLQLEKTILQLEQDKSELQESLSELQATVAQKDAQCSSWRTLVSSTQSKLSDAQKDADYLRFEVLHNIGFYLGGNIYHRYSCDKITDFTDVFCAPVEFFKIQDYTQCSCWNLANWEYTTYLRRNP